MEQDGTTRIGDIERLVRACQAGNKGAFDELVRLYQQRAMKAAMRLLGDVHEASEAVQEGFVKAYLKIEKLREPGRFGGWLLKIVVNEALSRRRAGKRRLKQLKIVDCYEDIKTVTPADIEETKELREAVKQAMGKLSGKEAKAITLYGMEELSQKEVSEIMGCSVEMVRWHVFKARKKLKVLLEDYL